MADTPNTSSEAGELYLDAAATEPVSPAVIEAMTPFLTEAYAYPASVHQPGKTAARALTRHAHRSPRHWAPGQMT